MRPTLEPSKEETAVAPDGKTVSTARAVLSMIRLLRRCRPLGILTVLVPGEPMTMYHWETDQEDFLVLSGEALVIIEGEERPDGRLQGRDDWGA